MRRIRSLLDRFLPRGALVLAILSFAYFAMGLVRNRVFAQTFGAGADCPPYALQNVDRRQNLQKRLSELIELPSQCLQIGSCLPLLTRTSNTHNSNKSRTRP